MLNNKNIVNNTALRLFTLLLFLSIITFHTTVYAGSKEKLFQQHREAGYAEQRKGNYLEALTYFSKAVSVNGDDPKIHNDMAVIYEKIGMLSKAEEHYTTALNRDSNYLPAYSNIAMMYMTSGYPEKAVPYFKRRIELSQPGDKWGERARVELLKLKPELQEWVVQLEAERLNQQLVEINHKAFIAAVERANEHFRKGNKHVRKNQLQRALQEFDQALQLTPDNPKIMSARIEVIKEMTHKDIRERTDLAIKKLKAGDSRAAKRELQQLLSNFPDESLFEFE